MWSHSSLIVTVLISTKPGKLLLHDVTRSRTRPSSSKCFLRWRLQRVSVILEGQFRHGNEILVSQGIFTIVSLTAHCGVRYSHVELTQVETVVLGASVTPHVFCIRENSSARVGGAGDDIVWNPASRVSSLSSKTDGEGWIASMVAAVGLNGK